LQYEWQFEILNSLPRERAVALVDHLRRTERERIKASSMAQRLQRTNGELERALQVTTDKLRETDPAGLEAVLAAGALSSSSKPRRAGCFCRIIHGLTVLAVVLVAGLGLAVATGVLPMDALHQARRGWTRLMSDDWAPPVAAPNREAAPSTTSPGPPALLGDARQAPLIESGVETAGDGKVRETTVREMTLRETTTREYDPANYARLVREHEQMEAQLQRLWMDIDDAVHKGQEMVCWKV